MSERIPSGGYLAGERSDTGGGVVAYAVRTVATNADGTDAAATAGGSTQRGQLAFGQVVTGNQAYGVGTTQPLNLTPDGRLKASLSSTTNINPAAPTTGNDGALLIAARYYATRPTWADGNTGSLQVNARGNLYTMQVGGANVATAQIAVPANTTTLVAAARAGRQRVTVSPTTSAAFFQGAAGVTNTTGLFVPAGASKTTDTEAALYVYSTAAITVSVEELF